VVAERTSGGGSRARYANEGPSLYSALLSDRRGGSTTWPTLGTLEPVRRSYGLYVQEATHR